MQILFLGGLRFSVLATHQRSNGIWASD